MPSSSRKPAPDAWRNLTARALLLDLADRGVVFTMEAGRLVVRPASRLTDDEQAAVWTHAADLRVLILVCDDRCLDRVIAWRRGALPNHAGTPGRCLLCGEPVPHDRARCAWCALASRVFAGAPLPTDLLDLFTPRLVASVISTGTGGRPRLGMTAPLFSEPETRPA